MTTTKKSFMEYLLWLASEGVRHIWLYECCYFDGSCEHRIATEEQPRKDFRYLAFEGDLTDVLLHRSDVFVDYEEPFHEPKKEYPYTLEELVRMSF